MRKPIDLNAELETLHKKAEALKAQHRAQLVTLLEKTGADQLDPEVLAGVLTEAVPKAQTDEAMRQQWKQAGSAVFRSPRRREKQAPRTHAPDEADATPPRSAA